MVIIYSNHEDDDATRPPSSQVMAPQPTDTELRKNDRRQDYGLKSWHKMKYSEVMRVKRAGARTPDNNTAYEHAQGCKICFCVEFPCPLCVLVLGDSGDNLCMCPCLFGVPLPLPYCLTWNGWDSWRTQCNGEDGSVMSHRNYVLVDQKAGVINAYDVGCCWDEEDACCTLVPLTSLTAKVDGIVQ